MKVKLFNYFLIIVNVFFTLLQIVLMKLDFFLNSFESLKLLIPFFCLVNILFFIYWIYFFKWPLLIFIFSFVLSFNEWVLLYQFPNNAIVSSQGFKIMSFNVRNFNVYEWIKEKDIPKSIEKFIEEKNPEIICFQEFDKELSPRFKDYPYKYFHSFGSNINRGSCIYSKFPILKKGKINFDNSNHGGIYIDVKKGRDTLKIINIHFESIGLSRKDSLFVDKDFLSLNTKILKTFDKQNLQVNKIIDFLSEIEIPTIICSDLNNNAFSIPYKKISMKNKDAFVEAGNGFGNTYFFGFFPLRIDYIFVDKSLKVMSFSTFEENLSDHNPIMAKIDFN
tara:strand:- start:739 stop:1743 length:1005 start_codon:yes stop_codon:yes gene_type:complete